MTRQLRVGVGLIGPARAGERGHVGRRAVWGKEGGERAAECGVVNDVTGVARVHNRVLKSGRLPSRSSHWELQRRQYACDDRCR